MGCYGVGPSRTMGAIVEIHHDDKGIIWPENVAPYQVHLLSLGEDEQVTEFTDQVYRVLMDGNIEVLYDDRRDKSAGEKFMDTDLIGIPKRLVASGKTVADKSVELKQRSSDKMRIIKLDNLVREIR